MPLRTWVAPLALACTAAASTPPTAIGPFTPVLVEGFESQTAGAFVSVPSLLANTTTLYVISGSTGVISTGASGGSCSLAPRTGLQMAGVAGIGVQIEFDGRAKSFGGYFSVDSSTADALVYFYDNASNLLGTQTIALPADCSWNWHGWQAAAGSEIKNVFIVPNGGSLYLDDLQVDFAGATFSSPTVYCTAYTTSSGCVPTISAVGVPTSSTSGQFHVISTNLERNKTGIFFYSVFGQAFTPFNCSGPVMNALCLGQPVDRVTPVMNTGGFGPCTGVLSIAFDTWMQGASPGRRGYPFPPGLTLCMQSWNRDPGAAGGCQTVSFGSLFNFSDAIAFTLQ